MVMVNSKDLRYLGTHGETSAEAEDTHQHSKLLAVRSEQVRPVVHQTRDQGLNIAKLGVNTKNLKR